MSGSITAMSRAAAYVDADNAMNRVEPGNTVKFDAVTRYRDVDTDPTSLEFYLTDPAGIVTTYVYEVDPQIVRTDIGHYHMEVPIPAGQGAVGLWRWRWVASGNISTELAGELLVSDVPDAVVVTLQDPEASPVKDALVTVFKGLTLIRQARTDATGHASLKLEDGTYQIEVAKDGYRAPPTSLIVNGSTAVVITATDLKTRIAAPVLRLCRVYGHVLDMTGQPMIDTDILVEPVGVAMRAFVRRGLTGVNPMNQGVIRDRRMVRARSTDGYWEIDLLCGSIVRLHIPSLGLTRIFRVPEVNSINIADVRTDVSVPSLGGMTGERYHLV